MFSPMDNSAHNYQLAIDFSQVQNIPTDPKQRLPFFQAFKQLLKVEKEKIKAWHRSGIGGREIIQAHTSLVDEVIQHVFYSMTQLEVYTRGDILEDFSLIAVGGYGRFPYRIPKLLTARPE